MTRTLTIEQAFVEAVYWMYRGNGGLAERLFRLVLKVHPDHAAALYDLGSLYSLAGVAPVGKRLQSRAVTVSPAVLEGSEAFMSERIVLPRISPMDPVAELDGFLQQTFTWFELVQKYLQVNRIDGVYAEFGTHAVNTFRFALNTLGRYGRPNHISHFYAFDSFEGMPAPEGIDRQKIWRQGMNCTSLEAFQALCYPDLHRITAVKGFFKDSLPSVQWNKDHVIALAYIDVDYYSSTREVLEFIKGKLRHGSVIAFDDWNCYYADPQRGQRLACAEFQKDIEGQAKLEPYLPISFGGMSFIYHELDKIGKEIL